MKLHSIQALRAVAAVLVVLCHASTTLLRRERVVVDLTFGAYGVDIFFIISGFILLYTTADSRKTPGEFLIRRVLRIFPLYFLLSTLMMVLVLWVVPESDTASADLPSYVQSILFIPHWNPTLHNLQPLIGQGWTLNYEMFVYVLFAVGLLFPLDARVLVTVGAISLICVGGTLYFGSNPFLLTYAHPLMMEFSFGLLLARSILLARSEDRSRSRLPYGIAVGVATAAGAYLTWRPAPWTDAPQRFLYVGLPSAALLFLAVRLELLGRFPRWTWIERLGDASYSLFLSHTFVLAAGRRIWQRVFDITSVPSHIGFILISTVVSIAVGLVLHRFVEKPINDFLTRAATKKKSVAPAA